MPVMGTSYTNLTSTFRLFWFVLPFLMSRRTGWVIRRLVSSAAAKKGLTSGSRFSPSAKSGNQKEKKYHSAEGEKDGLCARPHNSRDLQLVNCCLRRTLQHTTWQRSNLTYRCQAA